MFVCAYICMYVHLNTYVYAVDVTMNNWKCGKYMRSEMECGRKRLTSKKYVFMYVCTLTYNAYLGMYVCMDVTNIHMYVHMYVMSCNVTHVPMYHVPMYIMVICTFIC